MACPLCWLKSLPPGPRTLEWTVIFFKVFMLPPASAGRKARRKDWGAGAERRSLYSSSKVTEDIIHAGLRAPLVPERSGRAGGRRREVVSVTVVR